MYQDEAQAPLLVAMIENIGAVERLEDILAVEGLDAILVGPYDLSASMGITAKFDTQEFISTMNRIRVLCAQRGVACGVHVVQPDADVLAQRLAEGYRFVAFSIDSVFLNKSVLAPKLGAE